MGAPREDLDDLVRAIRGRTFDYEAPEGEPMDWRRYTDAQVHEAHDVLLRIRRSVDRQPEPPPRSGPGRPHDHTARDLAKVVLLQQYLGTSNRVTQGWALLFQEKLGLGRVPNYKAIERAYDDLRVIGIVQGVFDATAREGARIAEGFTGDGSALPRSAKANWESEKRRRASKGKKAKGAPKAAAPGPPAHGGQEEGPGEAKEEEAARRRPTWDGAVGLLSVPGQVWVAKVPHPVGFGSESPTLEPLVNQAVDRLGGLWGEVTLDAAFISRVNCTLIEDAGGVPRIFPKIGLTLLAKGYPAWRRMLLDLLKDPQTWLQEYHQRNNSESKWGAHKHRNGHLTRILNGRLDTERNLRFTMDNLIRLGYLQRLGKLTTPWLPGTPT